MKEGSAEAFNPEQLATQIEGPVAVIGDLHGGAELLASLLDRLRKTPDFANRWVVFAGDFIDRGPQVQQGLELVLRFGAEHGRVTACMGNHDLAALGAMRLIPTAPNSNWDLRYLADFDSFSTFASYDATLSQREFDANSTRLPKPSVASNRITIPATRTTPGELCPPSWRRSATRSSKSPRLCSRPFERTCLRAIAAFWPTCLGASNIRSI